MRLSSKMTLYNTTKDDPCFAVAEIFELEKKIPAPICLCFTSQDILFTSVGTTRGQGIIRVVVVVVVVVNDDIVLLANFFLTFSFLEDRPGIPN